jgi:hypothetical protein
VQAVLNLVRNPSLSPAGLFALARTASVYQPALTAPPTARILALLYTETDLYASGRIESWDARSTRSVLRLATRVIMVHVDKLPLLKRLVAHSAREVLCC